MSKITKEARKDAEEYARATMAAGEGAGLRRRWIENTVMQKGNQDPRYAAAFDKELQSQDMAEHAREARKQHKRKQSNEVVSRNARALATGNSNQLNTSVLVVVSLGLIARNYGWDKMAHEKAKAQYAQAKQRVSNFRAKRKGEKPIHVVTDIKK